MARSQPHSGPRQERTMRGHSGDKPERQPQLWNQPTTSTRSVQRERVVLLKQPTFHAQHVK